MELSWSCSRNVGQAAGMLGVYLLFSFEGRRRGTQAMAGIAPGLGRLEPPGMLERLILFLRSRADVKHKWAGPAPRRRRGILEAIVFFFAFGADSMEHELGCSRWERWARRQECWASIYFFLRSRADGVEPKRRWAGIAPDCRTAGMWSVIIFFYCSRADSMEHELELFTWNVGRARRVCWASIFFAFRGADGVEHHSGLVSRRGA
jgi:hypothetical protein